MVAPEITAPAASWIVPETEVVGPAVAPILQNASAGQAGCSRNVTLTLTVVARGGVLMTTLDVPCPDTISPSETIQSYVWRVSDDHPMTAAETAKVSPGFTVSGPDILISGQIAAGVG